MSCLWKEDSGASSTTEAECFSQQAIRDSFEDAHETRTVSIISLVELEARTANIQSRDPPKIRPTGRASRP